MCTYIFFFHDTREKVNLLFDVTQCFRRDLAARGNILTFLVCVRIKTVLKYPMLDRRAFSRVKVRLKRDFLTGTRSITRKRRLHFYGSIRTASCRMQLNEVVQANKKKKRKMYLNMFCFYCTQNVLICIAILIIYIHI